MSQSEKATLESWKEIAAYLGRDARTVRRWEKDEGLPIHRHSHRSRSSVYAYPGEIDAWRASRDLPAEPEARPLWRRVAFASAILLCLAMVGNGIRPRAASAQAASGITTRQIWAGAEVNTYGAPSPDGRFLSYIDWSTPALAIRDLGTGEDRRLMNGSWADPPEFPAGPSRFSPDGRQLFTLWFGKEEVYDLRIVGAAPEAATPRLVYRNEEVPYLHPADWSPDGKSILATLWRKDGTTQIALVSVADSSTRVLKSFDWRAPGLLRFSPDGRFIAYDFPPDPEAPERDIFVVAADGSRERPLVQHPGDDRLLGWSPDGNSVLFSSDRTGAPGAWLVEVAAGGPQGEPRFVKPNLGQIQPMGFTRQGSFYYGLSTGIRDIHVAAIDPATGRVLEQPRLASQRFLGANRGPAWSPDGESLAYFVNQSNNGRQPTSLFVRSWKTGRERLLRADLRPNLNIRPRWSPNGQWLLVNSRDERGRPGLYRVSAETGATSPILREGSLWGTWMADGQSIVYAAAQEDKGSAIRIRNLSTGEDKELFRPEQSMHVSNLALSPDGRRLAFGMSKLSPILGQRLALLPLDGGKPRELLRVTIGGQFAGLDWGPDGKYLFFARQRQMWRISTEGGEPQPLGLKPNGSDGFSVHPDGRRIAFLSGEPKHEIWVMENFLPRLAAVQGPL